MARKKERESKSALTERNTLIEEEKKLIELKAFVAKRALILKGLISNYIFIMFHYIFEPKMVCGYKIPCSGINSRNQIKIF